MAALNSTGLHRVHRPST